MLRKLYNWTMSLAATRNAERALFTVSFAESSFFPIPPDVLMIPMVISKPAKWFRVALICTLASILGAVGGYLIGMFLFEAIGQPILAFYGKEASFEKIAEWYNTWGGWGVLFAAITPFPYKVLTIFSGATGLNFAVFLLVSVIGRSFRFFLIAYLLHHFGAPIRDFIEKYLGLLFTLFVVLLIGGFYLVKFVF
ncbi:YqaA family protein [Martelella mediterranea]|uniref:Membrane protein YqaA with SNARE-associated domain n=1 Tax=Martelella mediterranea TaxID=293089 RepID=A0A4R3NE88_9HYPH|nr:YqaA family protein [Martelella mediterranea]TCT27728.1 membrane protein YqaA with SNARE-associated domain [Martelella mediterranea]